MWQNLLDEVSARRNVSTYTRQHKGAWIVQPLFGEGYGLHDLKVGFRFPAEVRIVPLFQSTEMGCAFHPSPVQ